MKAYEFLIGHQITLLPFVVCKVSSLNNEIYIIITKNFYFSWLNRWPWFETYQKLYVNLRTERKTISVWGEGKVYLPKFVTSPH